MIASIEKRPRGRPPGSKNIIRPKLVSPSTRMKQDTRLAKNSITGRSKSASSQKSRKQPDDSGSENQSTVAKPATPPTPASLSPVATVTTSAMTTTPMTVPLRGQVLSGLSSLTWQPASKRALDTVCVTDVTARSGVTVTIRECSVTDGFFRSNTPKD